MIIPWSMRIYQWSIIFAHHFRVSPNFGQAHSMLSKRCGSGSGECRNWKMSTKCRLSPTTVRCKEHATSELHSHWFVIRVEFQNIVSILFQMLAPREYRLLPKIPMTWPICVSNGWHWPGVNHKRTTGLAICSRPTSNASICCEIRPVSLCDRATVRPLPTSLCSFEWIAGYILNPCSKLEGSHLQKQKPGEPNRGPTSGKVPRNS